MERFGGGHALKPQLHASQVPPPGGSKEWERALYQESGDLGALAIHSFLHVARPVGSLGKQG